EEAHSPHASPPLQRESKSIVQKHNFGPPSAPLSTRVRVRPVRYNAVVTTTAAATAPPPEHDHFLLHDVPWGFYEYLLNQIGDRAIRVTFDDGSLEIMSPLPTHEKWKTRFGRLIELMSLELDIPIEPLGSTTFRRKDRRKGLEPDEC